MNEPCVEGIIERESIAKAKESRQNAIRSELFRRKLVEHHDYRLLMPATAKVKKKEPIIIPREPSPEFKELWFGVPEDVIVVPPLIDEVKRAVCNFYGLTNIQIISERRELTTTRPRQIAIYLAKHLTGKSYPEIARRFGKRDHTTAISSVRRIEALCAKDWQIAHDVAHLWQGLSK